ncbi:MAG TPA: septal ring lytic transglycosylase RlpA family protein [Pseudolabrys sp.]|nr:septal ring lytic transglycosylase RlpA family protein [Pseudolabrys sp.]
MSGLGIAAAGEPQALIPHVMQEGVTRIARTEPPLAAFFTERWSMQEQTTSDERPSVVVALAARHADDLGVAEVEAFAAEAPPSPTALLQLLDEAAVGARFFVQRWAAQADVSFGGKSVAMVRLALQKSVAWVPPASEETADRNEPVQTSVPQATAAIAPPTATVTIEIPDDPPRETTDLACLRPSIADLAGKLVQAAVLPPQETIVGIASFYDDAQETASGEQYDPLAFTVAAQLDIRDKFGGVRFGANYQPAYALAEYDGRKLIVKVNDVGPLRPGRLFDLSRAAMAYFGGLDLGLLPDVRVTPLPLGRTYAAGPISEAAAAALLVGEEARERPTLMAMLSR